MKNWKNLTLLYGRTVGITLRSLSNKAWKSIWKLNFSRGQNMWAPTNTPELPPPIWRSPSSNNIHSTGRGWKIKHKCFESFLVQRGPTHDSGCKEEGGPVFLRICQGISVLVHRHLIPNTQFILTGCPGKSCLTLQDEHKWVDLCRQKIMIHFLKLVASLLTHGWYFSHIALIQIQASSMWQWHTITKPELTFHSMFLWLLFTVEFTLVLLQSHQSSRACFNTTRNRAFGSSVLPRRAWRWPHNIEN